MKHAILQFLRDEQGATAIEYGLLAGLIAAVIAGTVTTLGTEIKTAFGSVCTAIKGGPC
ncbi:Flp family type IVb pilin [Ralstonia pseudosolanacearum]|uniref:Putative pilin protein n=1 Tax=Ralstonia solanacearum TaxID=305 RepID=A0A0S4WJ02_RALSL|nr:Flp family type IVb pilin [Ralstonia pseudosolanacearum]CUV46318.1 putative pilin protein [Ralstonia solanacearum]MDO3523064.1 Flp family type IVb pilin [Ralstonia pseudosolanacearum]MDO3546628.1 Flp family type IVb pilin [Ralstonia pseudosolanacearum]MDO3552092.1 Flp family type IVb pilin [Ralstonia pseudosolanacearum]MDO3565942.1 Flp family type IVb pilin [Ralstonia pseudosolanacearum]